MNAPEDEFVLIARFLAAFAPPDPRVLRLGPGDDAALLQLPPGELLAVTTDTLVGGRHFPLTMPPALIGWRALAVNLSDLAAMGARPYAFQVALTLPAADGEWMSRCGQGMAQLAMESGAVLAGGNLSRGETALTITALGLVPEGAALRRSGARPGDGIYVSGTIGLAGAGLVRALALADGGWPDLAASLSASLSASQSASLPGAAGADLGRYATPRPRLALGLSLRGVASAAVDVSDGLLADLAHMCGASGVGALIESHNIPIPPGAQALIAARAGDDYELCFTVPAAQAGALAEIARRIDLPLTRIGVVVPGAGIRIDGVPLDDRGGYLHF